MNKLITEVQLVNLPKGLENRYQLNLKLLYLNNMFVFDNEEKNKDKMFYTSSDGFTIYSYSFGKIHADNYRLRLPDSFFYNEKNVSENIISESFSRDLLRYEYLKSLKNCLEDWAYNWEGFREINEQCNIGFKKVIMNKSYWIV